jgi:hypothetical protein
MESEFPIPGGEMETNYPTVEIYFVFALTYCKLRAYEEQKALAQNILEALASKEAIELVSPEEVVKEGVERFQEVDTRLLLDFLQRALPEMVKESMVALSQPS